MIRGAGRLPPSTVVFRYVDPTAILLGQTCYWCGHAITPHDAHGIIGDETEDGQIPIYCRVQMACQQPSMSFRMNDIVDEIDWANDIARMEGEGGPPC